MVEYDGNQNEEEVTDVKEISPSEKSKLPHPPTNLTCQTAELLCPKDVPLRKIQEQLLKLANLSLKQDDAGSLKLPMSGCETYIGMCDRDSAVSSIRVMQRFYNFGADTFASAIAYMNMFLSKVKVKRRYLSCISAACFYLSAKMNEESEDIPTASELSSIHREVWKSSDLKRMEKLVLDKLGWSLYPSVSSLAFLEIMLEVLQLAGVHEIDEEFWSVAVERLELFVNFSNCCLFKSSTLALATLQQCLKVFNISTAMSRFMMLQLQTACQISDSELFDCQCTISQQFDLYNLHSTTQPPCLPLPRIAPRPSLVTRPSWYGNTDLPTIEEVSWDYESSEEEAEISGPVTSSPDIGERSKVPNPKLTNSSVCLLDEQCFVGKIGAVYGDYKCNITQA